MRLGFYPKLAVSGMRKNKRLYLPYILTCVGMIMMQYIIKFLSVTPVFKDMPGAGSLQMMLSLGSGIIAVFSAIFLFYTNSFLMRRRRKEFGLYNILGMDKFNIGRVLFWETVITAVVSLVLGLGLGIVFSKMAELSLINVMNGSITYAISVSAEAIATTLTTFCIIFALIMANSLIRIKLSNPIAMLGSESYGEKQPKGNRVLGAIGLILLGGAYYMAVSIRDPLSAMIWFFVAVIMVIAGTYLLFIAGSVVMCRLLQKNKKYYYKPNHFVSVSSMAYRMKRNGAGLASICILGTMVLVMIASTSCLYFGAEDAMNARYPKDVNTKATFVSAEDMNSRNIGLLRDKAEEIARKYGADQKDVTDYRCGSFTVMVDEDGKANLNVDEYSAFDATSYDNMYVFNFISLDEYNKMTGQEEILDDGQAIVYMNRGNYKYDSIVFDYGKTFEIKKVVEDMIGSSNAAMNAVPSVFIVVDDFEGCIEDLTKYSSYYSLNWIYGYNTSVSDEKQIALKDELKDAYRQLSIEEDFEFSAYCESYAENIEDFYGTFGGLFFLGIMLSTVFIFAAVLIIYYKQISEGYEDQARFEIMQKVGMTKKDIRKSVNSQLLTVFFLPLLVAGIHLVFAFPLINKLLILFNLLNVKLLILTTAISFLIFAAFYMVVYRITSNAYYKIVAGKNMT